MIDFEILPELTGQNVILKLPEKNEETALQIYDTITASREVFEKWMPWTKKVQTLEDCLRFLEFSKREVEQKERLQYLVFDKNNGRFYGLVCFYDYNPLHKRGEMGAWIDVRYHRCHFGFDAVKTLEEYLFSSGIHRLELHCEPDNHASVGLSHKLGYQEIALLKDYRYSTYLGKFCDSLYLYKLATSKV